MATPDARLTSKAARKSALSASANRAAHKAARQEHDSATAHKSSRRKTSGPEATDQNDKNDKLGAATDFAAMLAQTSAAPAAPAPAEPPAAGGSSSDGDALNADSAAALLRPWGALPTALEAGAAGDTGGSIEAAGAAGATAGAPAGDPASAAAAAAGATESASESATALSGGPVPIPSELATATPALIANAPNAGAAAAHRPDTRAAARDDQAPVAPANSAQMPDITAAATGADAPSANTDQSTADGSGTGQQPAPDFAGAAAAAGAQHAPAGAADAVSETPMPAHTVAPTIAQVAQNLRTSGDGTSRLVIRLDPVELGPVLVTLRTRGGAVDISVRADNAGGAAAVADQRAHIQQVLADHGLDLSSFNVSGGDASGGAGSSTADSSMSDASSDGSSGDASGGSAGTDPSAANYEEVQAQAAGADGQAGDRRAFAAPRESVSDFRTNAPTTISDGAAPAPARTVSREGTWL